MQVNEGTTAVVTGGTEGIGRAIAAALANRGARVVVCGRDPDRAAAMARELGDRVHGAGCDVADADQVTAFRNWMLREVGPPDVLVNNAGVGRFAPLEQLSLEDFDRTFAVNVRGIFLVTRAFLPTMYERGSGHIVNIASLAGRNGFTSGTAYAASKHAVLGLSKCLMLEARPHGVRVTAVCPGSVNTAFFDASGAPREGLERVLQPEDVADTVLHAITLPDRALLSELDIRPTTP